jgi:hypothetical protein
MGKGKGGGKSNKLFKISPDMCGFLVTTEREREEWERYLLSRSFLNFCI